MPTLVTNDRLREHAERLATGSVTRADLALGFEESVAASAEVLVEGRELLPADARGHRRGDVLGAHQPVRLPAGRRSASRSPRRCSRRRGRGSRSGWSSTGRAPTPEDGSREFYERLDRGGHRGLRRPRDEAAGHGRAARRRRATRAGTSRALGHIDHRKLVVDRRPHRLGRRGGDRGPLRGRPLPRPVPARHRARRRAAAARLPRELPLARRPGAGGRARRPLPGARAGWRSGARGRPAQRARPLPADHRRDRGGARRRARDARRRQPVRHRPRDDPAHRAGGAARRRACGCSCPRTRTTGRARRRSSSTTGRCSTRACGSSSTRRCSTRRRSSGTARRCSPGRATSRRGASSASSRSTCGSAPRRVAAQFDERFSAPAEEVSRPGRALTGREGARSGRPASRRSRRCSEPAAHLRGLTQSVPGAYGRACKHVIDEEAAVIAADYPFFDLILWRWSIFFLWIVWIWILIEVIADIFRRHDVSGWDEDRLARLRDPGAVPRRLRLPDHAERRDDRAQARADACASRTSSTPTCARRPA